MTPLLSWAVLIGSDGPGPENSLGRTDGAMNWVSEPSEPSTTVFTAVVTGVTEVKHGAAHWPGAVRAGDGHSVGERPSWQRGPRDLAGVGVDAQAGRQGATVGHVGVHVGVHGVDLQGDRVADVADLGPGIGHDRRRRVVHRPGERGGAAGAVVVCR